ncbi:MAG: hypothetical protein Q7U66_18065 [Methylobacter sp.]|nr:hypothetical protein [Methylobacter sp.]
MDDKSNFDFLKEHDPVFFQLAVAAEQQFSADPNTTLIKLRQLGEALAQDIAARCGVEFDEKTSQADLLVNPHSGGDRTGNGQADFPIRYSAQYRCLRLHHH